MELCLLLVDHFALISLCLHVSLWNDYCVDTGN